MVEGVGLWLFSLGDYYTKLLGVNLFILGDCGYLLTGTPW